MRADGYGHDCVDWARSTVFSFFWLKSQTVKFPKKLCKIRYVLVYSHICILVGFLNEF